MSASGPPVYLLDTGIIGALAWGGDMADLIDEQTGIRGSPLRPLVSIVTHGELRTFMRDRKWGEKAQAEAIELLNHLVTVGIDDPKILEGFAEAKLFSKSRGRTIGDNDLWIASTARATGAVLLTTDKDFDPLHLDFVERIYFKPIGRKKKK